MKRFFSGTTLGAVLLGASALTAHAQMKMPKTQAPSKPLNVAILVYSDVEVLDVSGPLDVLVKANEVDPGSFNVFMVATNSKPQSTQGGALILTPKYDLAHGPRPDIIIVPGASSQRVAQMGADERIKKWLWANSTPRQTLMSVCTGAFILARAGLLDGKNSTTHWFTLSDFQRQFPQTKAFSGVRFMRDGNVLSTAGVSSGIDGALQLVEEIRGKPTADLVARVLQYRRGTPSYPEQVKGRVRVQKVTAPSTHLHNLALDYDPVCHMKVTSKTANTFAYKGKLYGFCSAGCRDMFAAHPEQFIRAK